MTSRGAGSRDFFSYREILKSKKYYANLLFVISLVKTERTKKMKFNIVEISLYDDVNHVDEPVWQIKGCYQSKYWKPAAWNQQLPMASINLSASLTKRNGTLSIKVMLETDDNCNVVWASTESYDNALECPLHIEKGKVKAGNIRIVDKELSPQELDKRADDLNSAIASLNSIIQKMINKMKEDVGQHYGLKVLVTISND